MYSVPIFNLKSPQESCFDFWPPHFQPQELNHEHNSAGQKAKFFTFIDTDQTEFSKLHCKYVGGICPTPDTGIIGTNYSVRKINSRSY